MRGPSAPEPAAEGEAGPCERKSKSRGRERPPVSPLLRGISARVSTCRLSCGSNPCDAQADLEEADSHSLGDGGKTENEGEAWIYQQLRKLCLKSTLERNPK